ncbi:MAG: hypothetical protein WBD62_14070 [Anaerolineales bacterium]
MNLKRITIEQTLYLLILILAIGIRVLRIDDVPMSDYEAGRALQALQASRGENPDFSPGPAYPLLTGLTFFLFADNNAYARIWPILAGCCLVIFPYFIRSLIGRKAALILALGLALSPSLVAFSRIAGPEIMAVGFAMMAIGMVVYRKPILAGIFAGLTLLSGPSALQGLLGLGLAWLLGVFLSRMEILEPISDDEPIENTPRAIYLGLFSAVAVIFIAGTLFFRFPSGLGALTSIIPGYIQGWVTKSDTSISQLLVSLIIYNPIALIFGFLSIFQAWRYKDNFAQWLSLWAGISFILAIIYPGRDVFSWVWFLVPLWALASIEIAKYFRLGDAELLPSIGQALLIFLLMALGWLNLAGLSMSGGVLETNQLRWAIIAGTVVLGGVTTLLIGLGWSVKTAKKGLVWGLLLGFGFYGISLMWGVSQLRPNGEKELIGLSPVSGNTNDLQVTLGDLSEWRTGMRDTLDVVLTTSSPSLMWEMRSWSEARFLPAVPIGELPSVIINKEDQPSPNLSIGYRGQDFAWWISPGWDGPLPENWPRWLVFRDAPQITSNLVLWARGDLFPGGILGEVDDSPTEIEEEFPHGDLPVK